MQYVCWKDITVTLSYSVSKISFRLRHNQIMAWIVRLSLERRKNGLVMLDMSLKRGDFGKIGCWRHNLTAEILYTRSTIGACAFDRMAACVAVRLSCLACKVEVECLLFSFYIPEVCSSKFRAETAFLRDVCAGIVHYSQHLPIIRCYKMCDVKRKL
jgi:hypothetical protein